MPFLVFFILSIMLHTSLLFGISGLKSLASLSPSKEAAEVKGKDVEIKAKELIAKGESFQIARFNKEKFYFDIYWLGIYAGEAALEAVNDSGALRITSRAHSAPFISTFYKVEDYAESLIINGRAVNFRIKQREGRYRSDKETIFDVSNRRVIYFDYLKGKKKEHIINGVVWDVISGFYYLRAQPFTIGKVIYIDVFDSNKFYKTKVNVLRKEKIEISGRGEIVTVVVKPETKSEGAFHKKSDILIWLTDDEKRIPVRVETKVPIGKVVAELKYFEIEK
ncbi:MAG: DUF3108 domain-containing protein [Thermodesulfovibrionales bacterium]|nr:DUF3108 domain-containing protein [Thermodesulfovibrionales bacterium]